MVYGAQIETPSRQIDRMEYVDRYGSSDGVRGTYIHCSPEYLQNNNLVARCGIRCWGRSERVIVASYRPVGVPPHCRFGPTESNVYVGPSCIGRCSGVLVLRQHLSAPKIWSENRI